MRKHKSPLKTLRLHPEDGDDVSIQLVLPFVQQDHVLYRKFVATIGQEKADSHARQEKRLNAGYKMHENYEYQPRQSVYEMLGAE